MKPSVFRPLFRSSFRGVGEEGDDVVPTAFFNGIDVTGQTYTNGSPVIVEDHLGVFNTIPAGIPAIQKARYSTGVFYDTNAGGTPLFSSVQQRTRTGTNATTEAKGATLGVEFANASFDTNTVWIKGTGWTIDTVNKQAVAASVAALVIIKQIGVVGRTYKVDVKVDEVTSGSCRIFGTGQIVGPTISSAGTYSAEITLITDGSIGISAYVSGFTGKIDYISIRELIPTPISPYSSGSVFKNYLKVNPRTNPASTPGQLIEPSRTNYALNSTTPATHTTGSLAIGTYTLWQVGTGSVVATAGTAVGTFGTASNGTPANITITTAGTVVLTCSGTNTWIQLEGGAFPTSRIATVAASVTRQATVAKYPTAGIIQPNNMAFRLVVTPNAPGSKLLNSAYLFDIGGAIVIYTAGSGNIGVVSQGGGGVAYPYCPTSEHETGVPQELIITKHNIYGVSIHSRKFVAGVWGSWNVSTPNTTTGATGDLSLPSFFQLGCDKSGTGQFPGTIHHFDTRFIPPTITDPVAWAKAQFGVA